MNKLFLEGFETDEAVLALSNPHVSKLVREMTYKYGLLVYGSSKTDSEKVLGGATLHMGTKAGLPVCTVYVKAAGDDKVEYCYNAPWKEKQRGSSSEDRQTYRSNKLNILMATLHKNKVVPPEDKVIDAATAPLRTIVYYQVIKAYGDTDKRALDATIGHALLKRMFNEADDSIYGTLDRAHCRELLDKWNQLDNAAKERDETAKRLFGEPFYAIGVNTGKHYIVGKAIVIDGTDQNGWTDRKMQIVEPFKRIKSLYEVEELRAMLTMLKVNHDKLAQDGKRMLGGDFLIPFQDFYDKNLEVAYGYDSLNRYNRQWMTIPCSAL